MTKFEFKIKTRPPCLPIYPVGTLLRAVSIVGLKNAVLDCCFGLFSGIPPTHKLTDVRLDVSCFHSSVDVVYLGQGYTDDQVFYYIRVLHPEIGEIYLITRCSNRFRAEEVVGNIFLPVNTEESLVE